MSTGFSDYNKFNIFGFGTALATNYYRRFYFYVMWRNGMKTLPVQQAVGMILGHDMTEIIPGKCKHVAFKKGHIIKEEDIPTLLNMGKEHIYVMDLGNGYVHENDAAVRMAKSGAGEGIELTEPKEGKVNLIAQERGILKVNYKALEKINSIDEIMFATLHTNQLIEKGTVTGGTKIIPLSVEEEKIKQVEDICSEEFPIVSVRPLKNMKVGIVTTGNEVFYGRIKDQFGPVLKKKFDYLGCTIINQYFSKDDPDMIADLIKNLIDEGADIIGVTGGMSVDPDDVTPTGIKKAGAQIITYGAPTLPGAMFLLGYVNVVPIVGLPGCVMYNKTTIFDLIVPRLVSGERLTKKDIVSLGHGGLCMGCEICTYPKCSFGK